ncbi:MULTISPECIES: hypothetical protein [unclassified Streptomyces]|uniref:hypothetical protein n=1 Tax=unclassified Streptomyces TaxID=2593676 RepID=UPI0011655B1D|nr:MULTISPECIES: hypothetical protein [unclassified Streptomyces]NMI57097.1 hypothetical protein [Streptomyces sp. RLA2-12]QDN56477.1 hypothetical protein FNV67_15285 [Streptomyces sp. S1D4-20]QDN66654.1 hypothetical protein FNV66_14880 [Streptomyces sp. S1D4-14]QDO49061.1 hypothetical protein FNV60_13130 [Streptomyces sp. RLB3-5]QDO59302.1 hypothetical protein FNV59_15375 [Streptomyces sp. RLB1-8]
MTTSSRELIERAIAAVDARVLEQIAAARQRQERDRLARAARTVARRRGLARRHASKLYNLAQSASNATLAASGV